MAAWSRGKDIGHVGHYPATMFQRAAESAWTRHMPEHLQQTLEHMIASGVNKNEVEGARRVCITQEGYEFMHASVKQFCDPLAALYDRFQSAIGIGRASARWQDIIAVLTAHVNGCKDFLAREITVDLPGGEVYAGKMPVDIHNYTPRGPGFEECVPRLILSGRKPDTKPRRKRRKKNDPVMAVLEELHRAADEGAWAKAVKQYSMEVRPLDPTDILTIGCMANKYGRARLNALAEFRGETSTEVPYTRKRRPHAWSTAGPKP